MALSTDQYGYLIDPLVPITDATGTTINDGFLRVYIAGSSTPVITYRNYDGSANEQTIELDNSGRCKYPVIVSKSLAYKVVVYDAQHSQETPIITVDKLFAIGASVTAGAGSTIVQGLDNVEGESDGFVKAEVVGTTATVKLDATNVSHELTSDAAVGYAANAGYMVPALSNDSDDPGDPQKLPLAWIWGNRLNAVHTKTEISDFADDNDGFLVDSNAGPKFMKWKTLANKVLGFIKSLSTSITAFRTGDVIAVDGPSGPAKFLAESLVHKDSATISDCNDVIKNGVYAIDTDCLNIPSTFTNNGSMAVLSYGNGRCIQVLQQNGAVFEGDSRTSPQTHGKVWMRVRWGTDAWTNWESIGTSTEISAKVNSLSNVSLSRKSVTAEQDLNNYKGTGIYFINNLSTWAHCPITQGAFFTFFAKGDNRGHQIAFDYYSGKVYYRQYNTKWTDWVYWVDSENFGDEVISFFDDVVNASLLKNNLFDGNYISGISLNGTTPQFNIIANASYNSLAIIPIKPNTKYTILVTDGGAELNGYYYFKACTIQSEISSPSQVIGKTNTGLFAETGGYVKREVITTGASDTYLLVQASQTKQPFLQIVEGEIPDFTVNTYGTSYTLVLDTKKPLSIKYKDSKTYTIVFGDYEMELFHTVNAGTDADNWNIGRISKGGSVLVPSGTDIVGPIKLKGDNDFLGGVHGSETTTTLVVCADDSKVTLDSSTDVSCNSLTIYMESTCRRESNQSDAFSRKITIEIEKNRIHMNSQFTSISSGNLIVERVTNGGLMAVRNTILLSSSMNNYVMPNPMTTTLNNGSPKNIHAVLNTTLGKIVVDNIQGHEESGYDGRYQIFTNETPMRTKVYFDVYRGEKTVSPGDTFNGECEYSFVP